MVMSDNTCLVITGAIRGTSKEKLYQELGLESLQLRRWYRKLGMFFVYRSNIYIAVKFGSKIGCSPISSS